MEELDVRIEKILSQMTIDEKIGQLNQISSPLVPDEKVFEEIRKGNIGSFILSTTAQAGNDDPDDVSANLLNELQRVAVEESRLGIPVIFGRDVIHGHNTVLPIALTAAASFDDALVKECYRNVAREAARDGVHWTFSPMVDLSRDPRWGRCVEGPGEDPYLGSKMARAMIEGFQGEDLAAEDSVAACAKHYLGYGASEGGRDYFKTEISEYTIRNFYLPAYKEAVDAGAQTVMAAFNEISGQPCSSSRYWLTDVLKKELGFDGFIVSDWGAIPQTICQGVAEDEKQAAELCFNAGLDMEMVSACYLKHLKELIEQGMVSEEQLDDSVRRILRVKLRLGLFEKPYIPKYSVDKDKHKRDARRLAGESIVLLKNKDNILPLNLESSITLAGPMVTDKVNVWGAWVLDGKPEDATSVLEGIKGNYPKCDINYRDSAFEEEQLYVAKYKGDITVLCLGETKMMTGEANSVSNIEISDRMINIVKNAYVKKKPIVALLFYARPIAIKEIEPYCDAIVWCGNLGTETGNAVADVLFGKVNPSGKLPMTLPYCTGQIPIYYNTTAASRAVNGYYDGYLNYHDCQAAPMYPFGFGLSYSDFDISFDLSNRKISLKELEEGKTLKIKIKVRNISETDGREVVQLYVKDVAASMARPIRELKQYKGVFVKANNEEELDFEVGYRELGFYNANGNFVVEKGKFEIFVGNDCYADKKILLEVN